MKKITLTCLIALISLTTFGQDVTGQWSGLLKFPGGQLRVVINISKAENGYSATMDSPDQGVKGIPATSVIFENPTLKFAVTKLMVNYEGNLGKDNTIAGNFRQGGQSFPLTLSRGLIEKEMPVRPQEPKKPYPYYSEEVAFENKTAGITLAGTLTMPQKDGVFPVVVLISGSGPQNRDEELLGHKPFLVLSDYLTRNGIAVLRFDDRGTAASTGNFATATTMDFSTDVAAAVKYLQGRREINKKKIGLIGHSEGGIIAPIVAGNSKDISYIVLLAGTAIPGDQLLLLQSELIAKASGAGDAEIQVAKKFNTGLYELMAKSVTTEKLKTDLTDYFQQSLKDNHGVVIPQGMNADDFIKLQVEQIASPWMQYFIKYDPATALAIVKCPVLALNGEKDLQVPPKENLEAIKDLLSKAGNKKVTAKVLPNLNHLFQECKTGSPEEYATIEQTFSPAALSEILAWLQMQVR